MTTDVQINTELSEDRQIEIFIFPSLVLELKVWYMLRLQEQFSMLYFQLPIKIAPNVIHTKTRLGIRTVSNNP